MPNPIVSPPTPPMPPRLEHRQNFGPEDIPPDVTMPELFCLVWRLDGTIKTFVQERERLMLHVSKLDSARQKALKKTHKLVSILDPTGDW